jgi:hypothetical protein
MRTVTCETCRASGKILGPGTVWVPEATAKCRDISAADRSSWSTILSNCPSMAKAIARALDEAGIAENPIPDKR